MILGLDGFNTRPTTTKQGNSVRIVGVAVSHKFHACRKFLKRDGSVNYVKLSSVDLFTKLLFVEKIRFTQKHSE